MRSHFFKQGMFTGGVALSFLASGCLPPGSTSLTGTDPSLTSTTQASLSLLGGGAEGCHYNTTEWTMGKSGQMEDTRAGWSVQITRGQTSANILKANGYLSVKNTSQGYANVGNIVINLQRKVGKNWVTISSDLADATNWDAAASAKICSSASSEGKSSFSKNTASGNLAFTDAGDNSLFAFFPQFTLAPAQTLSFLFSASFDNSILAIPAGELLRVESIVTFANSGARGGSGASCDRIDINGNGTIDSKEAHVRSVPARYNLTVPSLVEHNKTVAVLDLADQISSSGTVSFSDFLNSLGSGSGSELLNASGLRTVSVAIDAGLNGGLVTNCAKISSDDLLSSVAGPTDPATGLPSTYYSISCAEGIRQQACSSIEVLSEAPAIISIRPGDFISYAQGGWGSKPNGNNPGALLASQYGIAYPGGKVLVGLGSGGFGMVFSSASAIEAYLPAGGTPAKLTTSLVNPTRSASGVFGGQVLSLELNIRFSDAGILPPGLGDLKIVGTGTGLDGLTVRTALAGANQALAGVPTPSGYTYSDLNSVTTNLNEAFDNGSLSNWAQAHLTR